MINFDEITREKFKEQHPNRQQIPDRRYRILIIGGLVSGKANVPLNLISFQPDIDNILRSHIEQRINDSLANVKVQA